MNEEEGLSSTIILSVQLIDQLNLEISKIKFNNEEFILDILYSMNVYDI